MIQDLGATAHYLVPLFAALMYLSLFLVVLTNRPWQKKHKLFMLYLLAAILWSSSDFLLRYNLFNDHKLFLFRIVICASLWWAIQLYFFARSYLNLSGGWGICFGYTMLAALGTFAVLGYAPPDIHFSEGVVTPTYGWWIILYALPLATLALLGVYSLVQRLRVLTDPEERNKTAYLIMGICFLAVFGFIGITPLAREFPLSHLGGLLSASILTYAMVKHDLVSINFVMRRMLGFASLAAIGAGAYLMLFFGVHLLLDIELEWLTAALGVSTAFIIALIIIWLRPAFLGKIDQLFYREKYQHRSELFDFVRHGISGVFSLQELSGRLLPSLVKVLGCQRAYMLLPATTTGDFVLAFVEPPPEKNPPLRIRKDSPIVERLKKEYLTRENLEVQPEFRGLWEKERETIKNLNIELIFPLISRGNLIGILALSKKHSGDYSFEDSNLVESIASQVAISLEKEYLQEELRKQEKELSLINRLAGVMTSSLNLQEVYDIFVSGLREVIEVDFATVAILEGNELFLSALSTEVGSAWQIGDKIQVQGTATDWVVKNKRSLLEPDLARDSMFVSGQEYLKRGIRSVMYLPLVTKGEGLGSLIIASRQPNVYTPEQVNLLERLASQISTSIDNARLYRKAEQRARIDELTGLFNRRHFDESLKQEISRHSRHGSMFSLVFLDLDNFKNVNDARGHVAGDLVLVETGRLMRESVRDIDLPCRYGGDEFAVIFPHSSAEDAMVAAERVRSRISALGSGITASMGLATWPSDGLTLTDLVDAADRALYYAKQTGGNRTCIVSQMLTLSAESQSSEPADHETLNTIYALAATLEARDRYTYGHSRKVRAYAVALAESLSLPSEKVALIGHAALLHDIGKIGIVDGILNKPGKLTDYEHELMKSHPQLSRNIVAHIPSLTPCVPAILHHHERWDGTGYPAGLKGETIPLEARILTIADAFDAMVSLRPYRPPLAITEAVDELRAHAATQFDPVLIEVFVRLALTISSDEVGIGTIPKPGI